MEVSKLLLYIITASFICGSFGLNPNNFTQKETSKLPRFICNVIKSTKREDSGLKTVAFVTTENKLEHSMIDDVMRCMPMEISTTLIDLRGVGGKVDVKAQLVVMLADRIDGSTHGMFSLLSANHLSKFLIITSELAKLIPQNLHKLLNSNGIQNFAILSEENGSVAVQRPEIFNGDVKIVSKLKMSRLSRQIFPDKLKDLQGYKYKVAIDFSSYGITNRNNRIVQRTSHLFRTIAKSQNASSSIINVEDSKLQRQHLKFDFIVDGRFTFKQSSASSIIFHHNSFCAFLAKSKNDKGNLFKHSNNNNNFVIRMFIIYFTIFTIWIMYKKRRAISSPRLIELAFNRTQSIQFGLICRLLLVTTIQFLMYVALFSNIFTQWIIESSLADPQGDLSVSVSYKKFAKQKDTKIVVDSVMDKIAPLFMKDYDKHKAMDRIVLYDEENFNYSSFNRYKTAVAGQCDFVKNWIPSDQTFYLYTVKDIFTSIQIHYGHQNPFIDRTQTLISYAFESGLIKIHEEMAKMEIFKQNLQKSENALFDVVTFVKLKRAFSTIFIGLITAVVVFVLEIFYHDFIRNLSWQLVRRWTTLMASRSRQNENINWQNVGRIRRACYFWRQRRNLRVNRINVRTVNA